MPLTTKRCVLSQPTPADKSELRRLFSSRQARAYLGGVQSEAAIEARCAKIVEGAGVCHATVRSQKADEFLGLLSLSPYHEGEDFEVSYEFFPEHWGHGYAAEALRAFLPAAMQKLGLSTVLAETQLQNTRSIHLLERLGMKQIHCLERFGQRQVVYRLET